MFPVLSSIAQGAGRFHGGCRTQAKVSLVPQTHHASGVQITHPASPHPPLSHTPPRSRILWITQRSTNTQRKTEVLQKQLDRVRNLKPPTLKTECCSRYGQQRALLCNASPHTLAIPQPPHAHTAPQFQTRMQPQETMSLTQIDDPHSSLQGRGGCQGDQHVGKEKRPEKGQGPDRVSAVPNASRRM